MLDKLNHLAEAAAARVTRRRFVTALVLGALVVAITATQRVRADEHGDGDYLLVANEAGVRGSSDLPCPSPVRGQQLLAAAASVPADRPSEQGSLKHAS